MRRLPLFLFFSLCLSCSFLTKKNENIQFGKAESLKIGISTRESSQGVFGPPSKIFIHEGEEIWLYLYGKYNATRLSLSFDSKNGILNSIGWFVREEEVESDLEQIKKRYPEANFVMRKAQWLNPHAAPDELYYYDDSLGIEVEYGKSKQKVKSLVWRKPGAIASSEETERQPAVDYEL